MLYNPWFHLQHLRASFIVVHRCPYPFVNILLIDRLLSVFYTNACRDFLGLLSTETRFQAAGVPGTGYLLFTCAEVRRPSDSRVPIGDYYIKAGQPVRLLRARETSPPTYGKEAPPLQPLAYQREAAPPHHERARRGGHSCQHRLGGHFRESQSPCCDRKGSAVCFERAIRHFRCLAGILSVSVCRCNSSPRELKRLGTARCFRARKGGNNLVPPRYTSEFSQGR